MSANKLEIILTAQDRTREAIEASRAALRSYEQLIASVGGQAERTGTSFAALGAKIAAAGYGAYKFAGMVRDAVTAAARHETLGVVMQVVGNNAGYAGLQMEAFAKGLEKTGISMSGARDALTRMAQAQLDLTKSAELARVAQDAAVIGNINSSEAFQRLVYGIQSAQVEILRTIGINVNFESSYQRVAKETGRAAASFSEAEKAAIRMSAALEAGAGIAGTYDAAMGTAGKQMRSLERHFENLKVLAGQAFTPALAEIVETITGAVTDLNGELSEKSQSAIADWATNFRIAIISIKAEFMRLAMLLDKIGGTMTSAQMLLYGPGAALGAESSTKRFEAAAQANIDYEKRYKATEAALEELARKQIALENSLTASGKAAATATAEAAEKKRLAAASAAAAAKDAADAARRSAREFILSHEAVNQTLERTVDILAKIRNKALDYAADIRRITATAHEVRLIDLEEAYRKEMADIEAYKTDMVRAIRELRERVGKAEADAAKKNQKRGPGDPLQVVDPRLYAELAALEGRQKEAFTAASEAALQAGWKRDAALAQAEAENAARTKSFVAAQRQEYAQLSQGVLDTYAAEAAALKAKLAEELADVRKSAEEKAAIALLYQEKIRQAEFVKPAQYRLQVESFVAAQRQEYAQLSQDIRAGYAAEAAALKAKLAEELADVRKSAEEKAAITLLYQEKIRQAEFVKPAQYDRAVREAEINHRRSLLDLAEAEGETARKHLAERIRLTDELIALQRRALAAMPKSGNEQAWNAQMDRIVAEQKARAESVRKALLADPVEAFRLGIKEMQNEWSDVGKQMHGVAQDVARGMQSAFSDFFFDLMEMRLKSLGDYIQSFLSAVNRALANVMANLLSAGISSGIKGWLPTGSAPAAPAAGGNYFSVDWSLAPNRHGNAFDRGRVIPFAAGGVVHRPTIFPMAEGYGLMGEAGEEAILPLRRLANGNLGVQASGPSGAARPAVHINFNVENRTESQIEQGRTDVRFDGEAWWISTAVSVLRAKPEMRKLFASGGRV